MGVLPEKVVKKCLWATGRKDPDYERLKEEIATPCEARFAMTEGKIIHLRRVRATTARGGH